MRKSAIVLATAGALALTSFALPKPAEARGFGPALAGGLIAGAVIGGIASSAYGRGPGYGYYDSYAAAPGYYGGPAYGYGPAYAAPYGYGYGYGSRDQSKRGGQPDYNR
jgi:hypothetical protein